MIEEDYCSYEVSGLLKKKGFDEHCIRHWDCDEHSLYGANDIPISNSKLQDNEYNGYSAPTQQKAHEIANNCSTQIVGAEVSDETYITTEPDCYRAAMEMAKWKDEQSQGIICGKVLQLRRKAYKKGYDKAIEKACVWLKNNIHDYYTTNEFVEYFDEMVDDFKKEMVDDFKKAMEERK